jgi:pilus assembly protein Flp/PilA
LVLEVLQSTGEFRVVKTDVEGETQMNDLLKRLWKEEEGQDLTEYALLLTLIALAAIVAMKNLGTAISNVFASATGNLTGT